MSPGERTERALKQAWLLFVLVSVAGFVLHQPSCSLREARAADLDRRRAEASEIVV